MSCEDKGRLAAEYHVATATFEETVRELQRKIGTSTRVEYVRLRHVSDQARVKAEQARLAFERDLIAPHR